MSSSDKDQNQNVLGSRVEFAACRSKTNPLQDRRLIVRKDSPGAICKTGSNSEQDGERKQKKRQQDGSVAEEKENICNAVIIGGGEPLPKLKVKSKIGQDCDENDDGFKTPTSAEQRIPAVKTCPPPPRKPKAVPLLKRRAPPRRRVLLDLTNEIELLFPPLIRADLGNNLKKIKQ